MALPRQLQNHVLPAGSVPGVYLDVIEPQPTPDFITALPVFLGYGTLDPVKYPTAISEPIALTRLSDLYNTLAAYLPDNNLSVAVQGFFENGGTECRVVIIDLRGSTDGGVILRLWHAAVDSLGPVDVFDLICLPSLVEQLPAIVRDVQSYVLDFCERRDDCFAILDPWHDPAMPDYGDALTAQCQALASSPSAREGAIYFPWVRVEGRDGFFPPCGHVAGVYRATDVAVGVHKAPANVALSGVVDLEWVLTDAQQTKLSLPAVNCLRALPGRGIRVWGARTLAPATSNWIYVSVRRLFISLGRWLLRMTAWAVFEPNNLTLWVSLTRQLNAYCQALFEAGGLKGATADDAYFVKCDDENNPRDSIDQGRLIAELGLAPVSPGEFIIIRLVQSATGAAVSTAP